MFSRKPKILVVDDDRSVISLIKSSLQSEDILVASATNGRSGLAKAKANPFDLIMLDINLPDMSGYQICEALKLHPPTEDVPVIILTVERKIENILKAFDVGAVDYLSKPFHPTELKKRIEIHLSFKYHQDYLKEKSEVSTKQKHDIALFISSLGHELRNPLNTILGFAEILRDKELPDEEKNKYLDFISKSGNDLHYLLNDIIDISKIESNNINITLEDTLINKELTDLIKLYEHNPINDKQTPIKLITPEESDNLKIKTDLLRINQVFRNLIDNALKYSEASEIEIGYNINKNKTISFFVKDNGKGIPKTYQQTIFDYFNRGVLNDLTDNKGKGLGLAICKNLVNLLGGKIELYSQENHGTEFIFTIKMLDKGNKEDSKSKKNTTLDWSQKTILITEDVMVNFLFLNAALKKTKAKILHAKDGFEAIEIAKTQKLDLILMDMVMPGISGMETTREIRKNNPLIPIIAQTSFSSEENINDIKRAGCNDILTKPVKPRLLLGLLDRFLE